MKLSKRLRHVFDMVPKCRCLADIGTDHGYIPIYAVLNNKCERAVASDVRKGPIRVANKNISEYGLQNRIETRIGPGLSVLKKYEADAIIIAGMGGYLIRDIIDEGREIAESTPCMVLQPVKHPEVLRKYIVFSGFEIKDEDLVKEDNKYYYIIKAVKGNMVPFEKEVYYYSGIKLIEKGHPLLSGYLKVKLKEINDILKALSPEEQPLRYKEIEELKKGFEDVIKCL